MVAGSLFGVCREFGERFVQYDARRRERGHGRYAPCRIHLMLCNLCHSKRGVRGRNFRGRMSALGDEAIILYVRRSNHDGWILL